METATGKQARIQVVGQASDPSETTGPQSTSVPEGLIGTANEVPAIVDGMPCTALVDTGSQVTTVSSHFYYCYLQHNSLHSCSGLVRIEGASGDVIPYAGYCIVPVMLSGHKPVDIPMLVVPDTVYNGTVPLLIGTNLLSRLEKDASSGVVHARVQMARRALELVDRHMEESGGTYGTVYAAVGCKVKPGDIIAVSARVSVAVPIADSVAMVSGFEAGPHRLNVTPGLVDVKHGSSSFAVELCNNSNRVLKVKPGDRIAQLDQVSIVSGHDDEVINEVDDALQKIDMSYLKANGTDEDVASVKAMLMKWKHIFSRDSSDIGRTDVLRHRIDLTDDTPVREKARRVPPTMFEELKQHISQLLDMGVIEESNSPYSSPLVLVRKKTGELRVCVDFRKLNAKTIKDSYRIPTIEELIDALGGASWYATLDLSSSYHQVEIEPEHKERTGFTTPVGFYQWVRMPFGLTNAPALFQRLMERVLAKHHLRTCLVYLDDIVVYGRSVDELKERLEEVFEKISVAGLKLKPQKCKLFHRKLKYLGHIVSEGGCECDPDMIAPVKSWKKPDNVKELMSFLGFANFYRRFIKDFAHIAEPLTSLLGCQVKKNHRKKEGGKVKEPKPWRWGKEQDDAFAALRDRLTEPPLLAYPDFSKPFLVRTDASTIGLGAVLCQDQGDKSGPNVIAYASRSLKPSEKHYSPYKLEFLALYWAVTKKFAGYLQSQHEFTVTTDHNPLTYVLTSAKLDSTGHRWLADLTNFHFQILYKPGRHNTDADALSRISSDSVKAICKSLGDDEWEGYTQCVVVRCASLITDALDWRFEQEQDAVVRRVVRIIGDDLHVNSKRENAKVLVMLRKRSSLQVKNGILYRVIAGESIMVLPKHLVDKVLAMAHSDMGHQGRDRTLNLLKSRFYWPGMGKDVQEFIARCDRCSRAKAPNLPDKAPLHPIVSTEPLDIVCMDYLSLESSKGGYGNILVITDHFTKIAVAIPTTSQTASNTAKLISQHFIYRHGIPRRLHSDRGGSFEAKVIKALCDSHGIEKSKTTPYHPEGNAVTERFNRTLLNMLRTLEVSEKEDWKAHVNRLCHAYNCTPHTVTGYSPYYLLYGRHPRLPLDALLGKQEEVHDDLDEYVVSLRKKLKDAYEAAASATEEARGKMKARYDKSVRGLMPQVGDLVLIRKWGLKGKHKLADKWEEVVYRVVSKEEDIPVYSVVPDKGKGRERKLHRNHMLPITWPVVRDVLVDGKVVNPTTERHVDVGGVSSDESDEEVDEFVLIEENVGTTPDRVIDEHTGGESSVVDDEVVEDVSDEVEDDFDDVMPSSTENVVDDVDDNVSDDVDDNVSESIVETSDAQREVDDVVEENDTEDDVESEEDDVPLRRSERQTRKPDFYQAGCSQVKGSNGDWKLKCEYLVRCMRDFPQCQVVFANAIAKIVTEL